MLINFKDTDPIKENKDDPVLVQLRKMFLKRALVLQKHLVFLVLVLQKHSLFLRTIMCITLSSTFFF